MARTHQQYSDELLAEHLAVGKTVAAAAHAAGISERTAYRRKKQPAVRVRIAEVRRAVLDTASGRFDQGMVVACDRLIELLGHANPHVQIRAAQTVIQMALKVRQEVEIADHLERIEEPPRPSPGVPVVPDLGSRQADLDPGRDQTDRSDQPRPPEPPTPDGAAGPLSGPAPSGAGIGLAASGEDRGPGPGLDPPPAPKPPGGIPGLDRRPRADRAARLVAMAGVLLLLVGLPCTSAGATRARVERGPAADGRLPTCQNLTGPATTVSPGSIRQTCALLPTCQNLTEPATAGVYHRSRPQGLSEHPAAASNSFRRVTAIAALRSPGRFRYVDEKHPRGLCPPARETDPCRPSP